MAEAASVLRSRVAAFDVIFLSFDEPNADDNWQRLLQFASAAKRVSGVKGIYNAAQACAEVSEHDRFYLVDADAYILDDFRFMAAGRDVTEYCFYWPARNAINDLVESFGCVKSLTKTAIRTMNPAAVDFFSSVAAKNVVLKRPAAEGRFNATPFLAWRGGFRACAKLASSIWEMPSHRRRESLLAWQTRGGDRLNGEWAIRGAREGARYGLDHKADRELHRVNDLEWLRARFESSKQEASEEITLP